METALVSVVVETALGWAGVALSGRGIRYATLFHRNRAGAEGELAAFGASPDASDSRIAEIAVLLQGYASDASASLDHYPVDLPEGTDLQRDIWLALREIPRGETRSYGWLARRVGHP